MASKRNSQVAHPGILSALIAVLLLGSLWGTSEVVLGGALRAAEFPYRAGLLTGVGMAIIGVALASTRRIALPVGIGLVAVLVNMLAVPITGVSVMCKANACLALTLESASLGLVAAMVGSRAGGVYGRMAIGGVSAVIASYAFYMTGTHLAPCQYLLSFAGPGAFVVTEGLVWGAFAAVLLPLGYLAGERLRIFAATRSLISYARNGLIIAGCIGLSSLAIAMGF